MHFIQSLCQVFRVNEISVLNLEEVLSSMPIPVHENSRVSVRLQALRLWEVLVVATPHHVQNGIRCQILCFIVDFNIFADPVLIMVSQSIECSGEWISWVACMVSGYHKQDMIVADAFGL